MHTTSDVLLDLFDHMESADAAVWTAVLASPSGTSDVQLCKYLLHVSSVQRAFLDAWNGRPFTFRNDFDGVHLQAELAAVRAYYPEARAFVAGTDVATLARAIRLPWVDWIEQQTKQTLAATTLGETMLQVISHSTHHRAQATRGCGLSAWSRRWWTTSRGSGAAARSQTGRRRRSRPEAAL
jgi:uncharacterized damage-inducible protein DinB